MYVCIPKLSHNSYITFSVSPHHWVALWSVSIAVNVNVLAYLILCMIVTWLVIFLHSKNHFNQKIILSKYILWCTIGFRLRNVKSVNCIVVLGGVEIVWQWLILQANIWSWGRQHILFSRTGFPRKMCLPRHIFLEGRTSSNTSYNFP